LNADITKYAERFSGLVGKAYTFSVDWSFIEAPEFQSLLAKGIKRR
jgi:hypothetical protein